MDWIKTSDRLPERIPGVSYSQVRCLCYWPRHGVNILTFNHEHECWDDESGDDHACGINAVTHWMPLPPLPPKSDII